MTPIPAEYEIVATSCECYATPVCRTGLLWMPRVMFGARIGSEGAWFGTIRYGKIERTVPVPAKQVSSIAFGGPDFTDIFITSAALSDSLPLAPVGYDSTAEYIGGSLFLTNLDIQGKPEFRARISTEQSRMKFTPVQPSKSLSLFWWMPCGLRSMLLTR